MPLSSGLLSIVKVTLINPETGKSVNTCALQDTGSTVTLIDKKSQINVEFFIKECRRELSGTNSAININEKVSVKVTTRNLKPEHIICLVHPDLSLGSTSYDHKIYKRRFPHLSIYQIAKYHTLK